jgi:mono/diheme cytochrome c family protein
MKVVLVAVVLILAAAGTTAVRAGQAAHRSVKDGVYTTAQAGQGKPLYDEKCASCHGSMASVTPDMAPLLNDHVFRTTWNDRSVGELFDRIRDTMPQNEPATLSPQQTVEIIAYILSANNLPAGEEALAQDVETLKQIKLDAGQP